MRTALVLTLWWAALFGWWLVLAGTGSATAVVAGAVGAGLLALFIVGMWRRLRGGSEPGRLVRILAVPWKVAREIGIVFGAVGLHLAGLRRMSSRYRDFEPPAPGDESSHQRHDPVTHPRASGRYRP